MSDQSSLLVEKLWRLKRRIDKGQCPGLDFIHLNVLLREPGYRTDVLRRVEANGSSELQALARDILSADSGEPLMAKSSSETLAKKQQQKAPSVKRWRKNLLVVVPVLGAAMAAIAGFTAFENRAIRITDDIVTDTVWETGRRYILEDIVFVDNAQLTVQPGVTVEGEPGSALIVTKDSQLFSRGTKDQPVVFTSHKPQGTRARGDWGGLVLLGNAPVNKLNAHIEGLAKDDLRGQFGGSDNRHSCGIVQFTRVEFAGFEISKDNELNGLTLGGCGSDTIVQYVQVHRALDDGIEMFGGSVNLKHILVTGAADDSLDWDLGWTGNVQFAVIQQHGDVGDNAFEGDNNGADHNALPRSEPTFYNLTLYGSGRSARQHRGMVLREGSGGHFHNMIIDSYAIEALDTRDEVTSLAARGTLTFSHNLLANIGQLGNAATEEADDDDYGFHEGEWARDPRNNNHIVQESALNPAAGDLKSPHFRARGLVSHLEAKRPPKSEFFDESADYLGAINPRASQTWLDDWAAYPES